jgi:hypothetical protein
MQSLVRRQYSFVSTLLAAIALISCSSKEVLLDVDTDIVRAFTYPDNSYWIFRDSTSGRLDSLALVNSYNNKIDYTSRKSSVQYNSFFKEYLDGVVDTAWWQLYLANDGDNNRVELQITLEPANSDSIPSTGYKLFLRPAAMVTNTHTGQINQTRLIPSIVINNHQFDSVYHVRFYVADGSRADEHFYFNRKVGFIKYVQRSLRFNRTLELERWYVPR